MNQIKIIKIFSISVLTALMLFASLVTIYENDIATSVLERLKTQLNAKLSYDDIEISFIRSFPHIRAQLTNVQLEKDGKTILRSESFDCDLHGLKLLRKTIVIRKIVLTNGKLAVSKEQDGKTDFEKIFSSDKNSSAKSAPIRLDAIRFNDVELIYKDQKTEDIYSFWVNRLDAKVKILERFIKLDLEAQGKTNYLTIDDMDYATKRSVNLSGRLSIDRKTSKYSISKTKFDLGGVTAQIQGSIQDQQTGTNYQVHLTNARARTIDLIKLLPQKYARNIKVYRPKGKHRFDLQIQGLKTANSYPHINIQSDISDAELLLGRDTDPIQIVHTQLHYDNGQQNNIRSSLIRLDRLQMEWNGQKIVGRLEITNPLAAILSGELSGQIDLSQLSHLAEEKNIRNLQGTAYVNTLRIAKLPLSAIRAQDPPIDALSANISLRELSFDYVGSKIYIPTVSLTARDDVLSFDDVHLAIDKQKMRLHGKIESFVSSLYLAQGQSKLKTNLMADKIDAQKLWNFYQRITHQKPQVIAVNNQTTKPDWHDRISSQVQLECSQVDFDQLHIRQVSASIVQLNGQYKLESSFEGFDGHVQLETQGSFTPSLDAQSKIQVDQIQVEELFAQFNNFDQNFISYQNISGKMDAKIHLKTYWDITGNIDKVKTEADAYFSIKDGTLKNLDILKQFSQYVDTEELENIRFSKLSNLIELRKGGVVIPTMFIQNSASNIVLTGYHTIDQRIHYNLKLNAGQLLGQKLHKTKKIGQIFEAQKDGWFNMYFNIQGTTTDFDYEINKELVKRGFEHGDKKKEEVLQRLQTVFGYLPDFLEPLEWNDIPEYDDADDNQEEKYLDGFEPSVEGEDKN